MKFNVLITSYELVAHDYVHLKNFQWQSLVVDEGSQKKNSFFVAKLSFLLFFTKNSLSRAAHRLKNNNSKLFQILGQYSFEHKLLLTGTPLQNSNQILKFINFSFFTVHLLFQLLNGVFNCSHSSFSHFYNSPIITESII